LRILNSTTFFSLERMKYFKGVSMF
jgi:hypothetical protein